MRIIVIMWMCLSQASFSQTPCDNALTACQLVIKAEDQDITRLKQDSKALEVQLARDNSPLLPWYAWTMIGIIAGGVAGVYLGKH
jgi:hypothetical protein